MTTAQSGHPAGRPRGPVGAGDDRRHRGGPHRPEPGRGPRPRAERDDGPVPGLPRRPGPHPRSGAAHRGRVGSQPSQHRLRPPHRAPVDATRTFTSVDAGTGTWTASFEGLAGIDATADPAAVLHRTRAEPHGAVHLRALPRRAGPRTSTAPWSSPTTRTAGPSASRSCCAPKPFEVPEQLNFGATQPDGRAPLAGPDRLRGPAVGPGLRVRPTGHPPGPDGGQGRHRPTKTDRLAQPGPGVTVFDLAGAGRRAGAWRRRSAGPPSTDPLADLDLYVFHDDEGRRVPTPTTSSTPAASSNPSRVSAGAARPSRAPTGSASGASTAAPSPRST